MTRFSPNTHTHTHARAHTHTEVCSVVHTLPFPTGTSSDYWNPSNTVVVLLHQRYFGFLAVRSTLVVDTEDDGSIASIEERWNHAPLAELGPVLRYTRRINGILSSALTPLFV